MTPLAQSSVRARIAATLGLALGLAALALGLAWVDVLPGAWTLHGWVQGEAGREDWLRERAARERLAGFARESSKIDHKTIIFLGSSTIERFDLAAAFPEAACLNRGLRGDTVAGLLERLDRSLPAVPAAGFVVLIGANDLRRDGRQPEEVRDQVARLLAELEQRAPDAPLLLLGLFPIRDGTLENRPRLERTNELLGALAEEHGVRFLPTDRPPLVNGRGLLDPALAADAWHLNAAGYDQLRDWILAGGGPIAELLAP